jgi:hypothetical protein
MRNIAVNAILLLKDQPVSLFVHGSVMTFRMDDKVLPIKASPKGVSPFILAIDLKVTEGKGPMKGTPKAFVFEITGAEALQYSQVTLRCSPEASTTIIVEIFR